MENLHQGSRDLRDTILQEAKRDREERERDQSRERERDNDRKTIKLWMKEYLDWFADPDRRLTKQKPPRNAVDSGTYRSHSYAGLPAEIPSARHSQRDQFRIADLYEGASAEKRDKSPIETKQIERKVSRNVLDTSNVVKTEAQASSVSKVGRSLEKNTVFLSIDFSKRAAKPKLPQIGEPGQAA